MKGKFKRQYKQKTKEWIYIVIRKFNNDGLSFQKAMEQLLIMKLNNLDKS